jgi:ribonuclease HII
MPWILGIDEAGYGPNLGPFIMTAVCCRAPDPEADLRQTLSAALRKGDERSDGRILVDDSKIVYSHGKGLSGLERGVFPIFALPALTLGDLATRLCDAADLAAEPWFTGTSRLPLDTDISELESLRGSFEVACSETGVGAWRARSLVVCPARFNDLAEKADSKSAVLAHGFVRLLADAVAATDGEDSLHVYVDKQGGRNTYAAQIQQALPRGMVLALEERGERSHYRVAGMGRDMRLTFEPRADGNRLCVAVASMVSKYLRELFMHEFNRFWQKHVPGLKPTAGYPADAARFLEAIRPAAATLRIAEGAIWRQR